MTASALSFDDLVPEPIINPIFKWTIVVGLHLALAAWVLRAHFDPPPEPIPLHLDVRTIALPPQQRQDPPKPVTPPPKPHAEPEKPVPHIAPHPVARPAVPVKQPPVQTASPAAEQPPASFAVPPQPAPPAEAETPPAPAPVTAARFDADYLRNPVPAYPALSRKLREEGKVLLLVKVTPAGLPEQVQIKQSSGFSRLDEAAFDTVRRQWRFVPARRGDEAISASVVVPIDFRLDT